MPTLNLINNDLYYISLELLKIGGILFGKIQQIKNNTK